MFLKCDYWIIELASETWTSNYPCIGVFRKTAVSILNYFEDADRCE